MTAQQIALRCARWTAHLVAGYPLLATTAVACLVVAAQVGVVVAVAVAGWALTARLLLARRLPGPVDDWVRAWSFGWRFRRRWLNVCSRCGVVGSDDRPPTLWAPWPTSCGARFRVRAPAGGTLEDLADAAAGLAAQLPEVASLDVNFTSRASTRGTLTARFADPLASTLDPFEVISQDRPA